MHLAVATADRDPSAPELNLSVRFLQYCGEDGKRLANCYNS